MDIRKWCNSGSRTIRWRHCCIKARTVHSPSSVVEANKLRLKVLWLKLKKEKRKMLESPANSVQIPYDPHTYVQNFDQGFARDELANLSRSFSVRFADPSRIFFMKTKV